MTLWRKILGCLIIAGAMLGLTGCTLFKTNTSSGHPLISRDPEAPRAAVYFIRPHTERAMGFSDNALTIGLEGEKLLELDKGEYTLLYLHPRTKATLTLENLTEVGPYWKVKRMARNYPVSFETGKTYYIIVEPVDGEFRGVYFVAKSVNQTTAEQTAKILRPVGEARKTPL